MDLVEDIAQFGGHFVELALQVGEDVVAKVDQALDLAASELAGDVVAGDLHADEEAGKIALGVGGGGGDGAGRRMGHRHGGVVDQGPPAGGENHDIAVGTGEIDDIYQLGHSVEALVALVP